MTDTALRTSILRRLNRLGELNRYPGARPIEMEICRRGISHWFDTWVWTYDPRVAAVGGKPAHMPLDLYERQRAMVLWIKARVEAREDGLLEKSRDIGFTWCAGGYAVHQWLFVPGFKTTFGSRKAEYVDRLGDPDSIFEKIRMLMRGLPRWMLPPGFEWARHDNSMRILNPWNGNVIRGEAGDEMGRGGRSTVYFVDEAAFIEHADRVEASTSANSDCRIWGSSANGVGNLFHRKRFGGSLRPEQIFRFHYTDDPRKDAVWAEKEQNRLEPHVWASEYDIDYSASVEGICIPAKWVESAKRISEHVHLEPAPRGVGGLDVGAGKARSVLTPRFGPVVCPPTSWKEPDTIETAHRALDASRQIVLQRKDGTECLVRVVRYDSVGVGHGVGSVLRAAREDMVSQGVNVGVPPTDRKWPDGATSEEKFANLKAEAWWTMRERFKRTHEHLLFVEGREGGQEHSLSELISLPPDSAGPDCMMLSTQLSIVKWNRNESGKIQIESKKSLSMRGVASPDHADSLALTFPDGGTLETWMALAS